MDGMSREDEIESLKEAKIMRKLDHPNIVRFKEVYRTKLHKLNIVMEYADGGDLSTHIKTLRESQSPMDEETVLQIFTQICLAMKHLHDRKILHRDLKA